MHWSVLTSEAFLIDLLIATACIVTGAGCVAMIRIANRQDRRREYDTRDLVDVLTIGTRVRVTGQDITGTIIRHNGGRFTIIDDDREAWRHDVDLAGEEGALTFGASDLEVDNDND